MIPTLFTFLFIFGLLIGSFLNVLIYRLPVMLFQEWEHPPLQQTPPYTLARPRSHCPRCKHRIAYYDNIPLLSFILLKAHCRHCKAPISWRYPLVELASGLLTLFIVHHYQCTLFSIPALLLSYTLLALSCIDLDHHLLPDELTLPLLWLGLLWPIFTGQGSLQDHVLGAACGYLSLYSIYWIFKCCTGKEGLGYGDFKLLAMLGAWLGIAKIPLIILLSSALGSLVGIVLLYRKKIHFGKEMPFGPYLAFAGWFILLYGEPLQKWYWHMLGW